MDAKAPFFDGDVGPCLRDQFVLADDLPGLVDKGRKELERPPADRNDLARLLQGALGGAQLEWTKLNPRCAR
jgi:hypothetical protein